MLSRKPLRGLANRFQPVNECIVRLYRQLDRDVIRFAKPRVRFDRYRPSPTGAYRFAPDPSSERSFFFFLGLYFFLMLETTKTLVYCLSASLMERLMSPSIRR